MPPTNHAIARRSFNDLPRELVIRIVHLAKISGELYPISDPEEYPFYKSLRLTSRLLWRVATPLLYEVVVLYKHTESWASLNNIAGTSLSSCVKTILLSTLPPFDGWPTADEWCQAAAPMRGMWPWGQLENKPPDGGPYARIDSQNDDECFARYERWRHGEAIMTDHAVAGTAPALRVQSLVSLTRVRTVNHRDLAFVRVIADNDSYAGFEEHYLTRREVETCLPDRKFQSTDHDQHLKLLATAYEVSGLAIPSLTIRSPWAMFYNGNDINSLGNLRRLEVNLLSVPETRNGNSWIRDLLLQKEAAISGWIKSLTMLEELSVIGGSPSYDVFNILNLIFFPNLRRINLQGAWLEPWKLEAFLDKHWKTLEHVRIQEPLVVSVCRQQLDIGLGDLSWAETQALWEHTRRVIQNRAAMNGATTDLSLQIRPRDDRRRWRYLRYEG